MIAKSTFDPQTFEKALLDPDEVFGQPEDVVHTPGLTKAQKLAVLKQWANDSIKLHVADWEGMLGSDQVHLHRIVQCMDKLS